MFNYNLAKRFYRSLLKMQRYGSGDQLQKKLDILELKGWPAFTMLAGKPSSEMKKKPQNFANHVHWVPLYHYFTFAAMATLLVGGMYLVTSEKPSEIISRLLFLLMVLTVISVSFHCRSFALKVQDRAIRAEENLRYFMLTGKRLHQGLTLKQVIALRFASDDEFVDLADRAVRENLSSKEIKKLIQDWRADYIRA